MWESILNSGVYTVSHCGKGAGYYRWWRVSRDAAGERDQQSQAELQGSHQETLRRRLIVPGRGYKLLNHFCLDHGSRPIISSRNLPQKYTGRISQSKPGSPKLNDLLNEVMKHEAEHTQRNFVSRCAELVCYTALN